MTKLELNRLHFFNKQNFKTMLTEDQKLRIDEVLGLSDLKGIDTNFVREFYPEQSASGKVFVVAITEEREWANGENGTRALLAQQQEIEGDTNNVSLAISLLNGWSVGNLYFAYVNAGEKGVVANDESSLGAYMEDLIKARFTQTKSPMTFLGCRINIKDSLTPFRYKNKNGEEVVTEPRKNRKGEVLYDEDGNPIYRQTFFDVWVKKGNVMGKPAPDTILKGTFGASGDVSESIEDLTGALNVSGAID